MKNLSISCLFACSVVGLASSSRSQPAIPPAPGPDPGIAVTGQPSMPEPGDERPSKDPFTPYDIGDPAAAWTYEHLTPAKRVIADRGRDAGTSAATHDAYGSAAAALAAKAASEAAALQLRPRSSWEGIPTRAS